MQDRRRHPSPAAGLLVAHKLGDRCLKGRGRSPEQLRKRAAGIEQRPVVRKNSISASGVVGVVTMG